MNKSLKLVNLTTHHLRDVASDQEFPPSGTVAKVDYHRTSDNLRIQGYAKEIKVSTTHYKNIVGLPPFDKDNNILYVVSAFIINALAHNNDNRTDIVAPGPKITGAGNQTVGCNSFRFNG